VCIWWYTRVYSTYHGIAQGVQYPPWYSPGCTSQGVSLTGVPLRVYLSRVYHAGYTHGCTMLGIHTRVYLSGVHNGVSLGCAQRCTSRVMGFKPGLRRAGASFYSLGCLRCIPSDVPNSPALSSFWSEMDIQAGGDGGSGRSKRVQKGVKRWE